MSTQAAPHGPAGAVATVNAVAHRYGNSVALESVTLSVPGACMVGLIGPDGVGKSTLLSLLAGARSLQSGQLGVLGGDMRDAGHRRAVCPRIAYMPQGLGRNLYASLSVRENIEFFARLFGHGPAARQRRIDDLLQATQLAPFAARAAGKLSGGMRQKLGLCCALIHDPEVLILDEPTTGVDPLSRRQFWELIAHIRADSPAMSVLVATAYMDEAAQFDWLVAMSAGRVLATGTAAELTARTDTTTLEDAFIALLPQAQRAGHHRVVLTPRAPVAAPVIAIEARALALRFGDFTAVDDVSFRIERGEIFGFLGSNGCGKTTTMKMLTGLLPASAGEALLFGHPVAPGDLETRRRVGYMTQSFSLYGELTVRQNLVLHGRIFGLDAARSAQRIDELAARFDLTAVLDELPEGHPVGVRQRMSLAVALLHEPEILILDEPTSGVDPLARDAFWRMMLDIARRDEVTIFISTHYMAEAVRCDRISLMHAGRVLTTDTPAAIIAAHGVATLEEAFIACLERAGGTTRPDAATNAARDTATCSPVPGAPAAPASPLRGSLRRMLSFAWREALELRRDPIRQALALIGSGVLMLVLGYGITMDVENLSFAVLDRDQTTVSRDYALNLAGSRYFREQPPLRDHADLDRRMRAGALTLAIEIPPDFARDLARGRPVAIAAWVDGAMPSRAETLRGYALGMHLHWLATRARRGEGGAAPNPFSIETRFRYNPDVRSVPAIVPAVMPLLLMLIPAILTAVAVVREKELGSIVNLYVTPATRLEFLLGKQLPYVVLAMASFLLLMLLALLWFKIPLTGSFLTLGAAALLYVTAATAIGLVMSAFMRSQTAALFGTAVLTILPAVQFSGMLDPVSSLEGVGALIGRIYPTTHFLTIARGTFAKGLGLADLQLPLLYLALAVPLLTLAATLLLRKQAR